jgi:hypothetical protein
MNNPLQIAFILDDIDNYQSLINGLPENMAYQILDANGDALTQMADALAAYQQLDAIHIFSHGSAAALHLGSMVLTADNLNTHADTLARIGQSLTSEGDLLLYGCNVAQGGVGRTFIEEIARLTQADVAASTNATGSGDQGGDWTLEFAAGDVEADEALDVEGAAAYSGVLAEFTEDFSSFTTVQYWSSDSVDTTDQYNHFISFTHHSVELILTALPPISLLVRYLKI